MIEEKSKYIGFRCPIILFEKFLEGNNFTDTIIDALEQYENKEILKLIKPSYKLFNSFFRAIKNKINQNKKISDSDFNEYVNIFFDDEKISNIDKLDLLLKKEEKK
ncbi:MAG: hypothetical protein ACFFG0_51565 [Candidatus Thorarchaeota archaeon]